MKRLAVFYSIVILIFALWVSFTTNHKEPFYSAKEKIIVSLTSYGDRINRSLNTLESLMRQDYPNYEVHFYIEEDLNKISGQLKGLQRQNKNKLFFHDIKAYKKFRSSNKIVHALKSYAGKYRIAICDDDQLYDPKWLSKLDEESRPHTCVGFSGMTENKKGIIEKVHPGSGSSSVLWSQGYTGYILPKSIKNDYYLFFDNIEKIIPDNRLMMVDDVLIGAWLSLQKINRLKVSRTFGQRDSYVHKDSIWNQQLIYNKNNGQTMTEKMYFFLKKNFIH